MYEPTPEMRETWRLQKQAFAKIGQQPTEADITALDDDELEAVRRRFEGRYLDIQMSDTLHTSTEWSRLAATAEQHRRFMSACATEQKRRESGSIAA